jgi:PKD repeat protein
MKKSNNPHNADVMSRTIIVVVILMISVGFSGIASVGPGTDAGDENVSANVQASGVPSIEIIELETVEGDPLISTGVSNVHRVAPHQDFRVVVKYENLSGSPPYKIQIVDDDPFDFHNVLVTTYVSQSDGQSIINISSSNFPLEYGNDPTGFETEARWVADDGTVQAHSAEYQVGKAVSTIYLDSDSIPDTVAEGESVTVRAYGWSDNALDVQLWNVDTDAVIDHKFWNADNLERGYEKEYTFVASDELSQSPPDTLRLQGRTNQGGPDSSIHSINITSGNNPPTASFTYSPTNPTVGEIVTFDASGSGDSDGSIQSYSWDLDNDGMTDATGPSVSFSFETTGNHQVSLTVTDDRGASDTASQTVAVGTGDSTTVSLRPGLERVTTTENATFDVRVDTVDNGVSAYSFNVSINDTSVGEITDVSLVGPTQIDGTFNNITYADDNSSVMAYTTSDGDVLSDGTIATVTVSGVNPGNASLSLEVNQLADQDGNDYTISGTNGATLEVVETNNPGTQYDVDGDDEIDTSELRTAIDDWAQGADNALTTQQLRTLIDLWAQGDNYSDWPN